MNHTTDQFLTELPWGRDVRLLGSHPNGLIAVYKPGGVLSHPNDQLASSDRAVLNWKYDLKEQCYRAPSNELPDIHLLHRIDSPTSGVILLAMNDREANRVRNLFETRSVEKTYYAIVLGRIEGSNETWSDHLDTRREKGHLRAVARRGTESVTDVRSMIRPGREAVASLLEFKLRTGRTHQIRVQCAKRRLPILGDQTYGDFKQNREWAKRTKEKDLYLHAARLRLPMGKNQGLLSVAAAFPDSFLQALPRLGLTGRIPFTLEDRFRVS